MKESSSQNPDKKKGCPKCGSTKGFESRITGWQYYTCEGEPDGYEMEAFGESRTIRCRNCGYRTRVASLAAK